MPEQPVSHFDDIDRARMQSLGVRVRLAPSAVNGARRIPARLGPTNREMSRVGRNLGRRQQREGDVGARTVGIGGTFLAAYVRACVYIRTWELREKSASETEREGKVVGRRFADSQLSEQRCGGLGS